MFSMNEIEFYEGRHAVLDCGISYDGYSLLNT